MTQLVLLPLRTLIIFVFPSVPAPTSAPWECEKCKKRSRRKRSTRNNKICFTLLILHTQITVPFTPSFHWGCTAWAIGSQTPSLSLPIPTGLAHPCPLPLPGQPSLTNQHVVQQVTGTRFVIHQPGCMLFGEVCSSAAFGFWTFHILASSSASRQTGF